MPELWVKRSNEWNCKCTSGTVFWESYQLYHSSEVTNSYSGDTWKQQQWRRLTWFLLLSLKIQQTASRLRTFFKHGFAADETPHTACWLTWNYTERRRSWKDHRQEAALAQRGRESERAREKLMRLKWQPEMMNTLEEFAVCPKTSPSSHKHHWWFWLFDPKTASFVRLMRPLNHCSACSHSRHDFNVHLGNLTFLSLNCV